MGKSKEMFAEMRDRQTEDSNAPLLDTTPTPKGTNLLALDVATKTGWCTKHAHGTWDLKIRKDESHGMKLLKFRAKLKEICHLEEIGIIAFERTSGMHKASLIHQSELHSVLKVFCEDNGIQYNAYSAAQIKQAATGKGNAGKPQMIEAARVKYGYEGDDDNTADAIHIYHLAKKDLGL